MKVGLHLPPCCIHRRSNLIFYCARASRRKLRFLAVCQLTTAWFAWGRKFRDGSRHWAQPSGGWDRGRQVKLLNFQLWRRQGLSLALAWWHSRPVLSHTSPLWSPILTKCISWLLTRVFRRRASAPIYTCTSSYGNSRNLALSASSVLSSRRLGRPLTDLQSPAYSKGNQCGSRAVCILWMLSLPWSKATLSLRRPWAAKSQISSFCLLQLESPFS